LLAVDVFGKLGDFGAYDNDHDSCCVSTSCSETLRIEETALVYGHYFADEEYSPVRPMVLKDWVAYDTFTTWKASVNPEVFQAMRDFLLTRSR